MNDFPTTTALIVGGSDLQREGLRCALESAGIALTITDDGSLAKARAASVQPELIIVDTDQSESALGVCATLRKLYPDARLVLMADDCDVVVLARAFRIGIHGYLIRSTSWSSLVGVLRLILAGEKFIPSSAFEELSAFHELLTETSFSDDCAAVQLSNRETEILQQIAGGYPNKVIAQMLAITEATVKVHMKTIMRKLRVRNRTQAAAWAIHRGGGRIAGESVITQH